jgi:hypothetical protein
MSWAMIVIYIGLIGDIPSLFHSLKVINYRFFKLNRDLNLIRCGYAIKLPKLVIDHFALNLFTKKMY